MSTVLEDSYSFTIQRDGKTVRVTQTLREVPVEQLVAADIAARRQWPKYGVEKGAPPGASKNTTDVEENEVVLRLFPKTAKPSKDTEQQAPDKKQAVMSTIACRNCGGQHFSHTCPFKDRIAGATTEEEPVPESTNGKYVPPGRKGGILPRDDRDELKTLRVSNLPEDIDDRQLRAAFNKLGSVTRCHVVREKDTNKCRGFAFISFDTREGAERAYQHLNGKAIGHLVMRVEFSKKKPT